jgi:gluconolactonase
MSAMRPSVVVAMMLGAAGAAGVLAERNMTEHQQKAAFPTPPGIERLDPALDQLIDARAAIEVLAGGYDWSEGPVWVKDGGYLLFSDIPPNRIHRWKEGEGARLYLTPSGYTSSEQRGGEVGSNGLIVDRDGRLLLAQHGDRRIARMEAPLSDPQPKYATLADRYEGKRFNSPNDLIQHSSGDIYFTDPAYGLEKQWDDPKREMDYAGTASPSHRTRSGSTSRSLIRARRSGASTT